MMFVQEPDPKTKTVDDLDITFSNGLLMPITISKADGDTVDMDSHKEAIVIHLSSKPSADGMSILPAEDITIFRSNILCIQHRVREVTETTQAQKDLFKQTIQEMSQTRH